MISQFSSGQTTVISVDGDRIDASMAMEFRQQLRDIIDAGQRELVLDLSNVDFIDSSGLGAIVGAFKHLGNAGHFVLAGLSEPVLQLFALTRMDRVFQIYPDVAAAAAAGPR